MNFPNLHPIGSDQVFTEVFNKCTPGNSLTVLYFTATWCGPCRQIAPVVESLASQFTTSNFLKVDLDGCSETALAFNIRSVPHFIFLVGQTTVFHISGANEQVLRDKVKEIAAHANAPREQGWEVKQFQDVCNCSEEEAKHYLNAYNNDLDTAISSYLNDANDETGDSPAPVLSGTTVHGSSGTHKPFATLSSIRNSEKSDGSDEEEGQAFYVGGSEGGGGQQVLGPKKDKKLVNNEDLVTKLFDGAKSSGAEVMTTTRVEEMDKSGATKAFTGTAYRLGSDLTQPSALIAGSSKGEGQAKPTVIKMWSNGFSLDDGPLREFDDPASREFLGSIQRGEVPQELLRAVRGGQANVMLEDHRNEDYKEQPKPKVVPFSGSGQMLGAASPKMTTTSSTTPAGPVVPGPPVDASKPVTKIQVRLADGSRLVVELNHQHSVADLRRAIISQRPNYAGTTFSLMTTFPNKQLTDETATMEEAKLLSATVVQKLV